MRIGEFAKKHNTTLDTIRHYLNMELLVTEKTGGQYRFDEEDSWALEKIIELKSLQFSLSEIQEILCFHRLAGDMTTEYRNYYVSLLESKKEHFGKEIQNYKTMQTIINDRIMEFKSNEEDRKRLGLPMSSIEILQCPNCNRKIEILNGNIVKNMIMEANIKCECGYSATIENGIYVDAPAIKEKTLNGKKAPTKREFLEAASPKFINFYYNGMTMLVDYILKYGKEPKCIMELDTCAGAFLMQYLKHMPIGSTYILICQDKERMGQLKDNMEMQDRHINFIFLCCDFDKLPIANSSIDIMIDNGMSKEYAKTNNQFLPEMLSSLIKKDGLLVGKYNYFDTESKCFSYIEPEIRAIYTKGKTLEKLINANYQKIDLSDIGPVIENNPYNIEINNRELYSVIYAGRKID